MTADKQDIKNQVKIPDVLHALGIPNNNQQMRCPIHRGKNKNFFWKPDSWHCYSKCQDGGDVFYLVQLMYNCDFLTAKNWICEQFGIEDSHEEINEFDKLRWAIQKKTKELAAIEQDGKAAVIYNQLAPGFGVPMTDTEALRRGYKKALYELDKCKHKLFSGSFNKEVIDFMQKEAEREMQNITKKHTYKRTWMDRGGRT
jgi:hypothetical protein